MIRVDGLSLKIHGRILLEDISFTLEEGRVYALLGENGSGKTTLMRCLSSTVRETRGRTSTPCFPRRSPRSTWASSTCSP